MTAIIEIGNGERTPFTASTDPLLKIDPILSRLSSVLKVEIPGMFGDLRFDMPPTLAPIISQALPYRPTTIQLSSGLDFPLLAIWRDKSEVIESSVNSIQIRSEISIAYIIPPLSNSEMSKWAGIVERVGIFIASLIGIGGINLNSSFLRNSNEAIEIVNIEYGTFIDETGLELPSSIVKGILKETWLFHGFTTDSESMVGIDYSIGSESIDGIVETSQTFGD